MYLTKFQHVCNFIVSSSLVFFGLEEVTEEEIAEICILTLSACDQMRENIIQPLFEVGSHHDLKWVTFLHWILISYLYVIPDLILSFC